MKKSMCSGGRSWLQRDPLAIRPMLFQFGSSISRRPPGASNSRARVSAAGGLSRCSTTCHIVMKSKPSHPQFREEDVAVNHIKPKLGAGCVDRILRKFNSGPIPSAGASLSKEASGRAADIKQPSRLGDMACSVMTSFAPHGSRVDLAQEPVVGIAEVRLFGPAEVSLRIESFQFRWSRTRSGEHVPALAALEDAILRPGFDPADETRLCAAAQKTDRGRWPYFRCRCQRLQLDTSRFGHWHSVTVSGALVERRPIVCRANATTRRVPHCSSDRSIKGRSHRDESHLPYRAPSS